MKKKLYNINTFSFYRRQVKPEELDKAFIKLIEDEKERLNLKYKEKKKNKENYNINTKNISVSKNINKKYNSIINNQRYSKKVNLNLIFPKISMERIMKIRDLFLEFDAGKNHTINEDEIYIMFNMNKIPITREEVADLFGFTRRKKSLSFYDFIQLTVNEYFSNKFKKLIMEKIRYRTNESDICPNDFNDMLSHLCEFGKLSHELKDKRRKGQIETSSENEKYSHKFPHENNKVNQRNSIISEIVYHLTENKIKDKFDFNNEKDLKEIRDNPNLLKKEKEFTNFMEINNKKFLRFKEYLIKANIKDKIYKRKEELSKSVKIINNINPEIAKNYICYYPTENIFKNFNNNKIISFSTDRNKTANERFKYNNEEKSNIVLNEDIKKKRISYFQNYFSKNVMKLIKNNIKNNIKNRNKTFTKFLNSSLSKDKSKKRLINYKEYFSILEKLCLKNNYLLPVFQQAFNTTRFKSFNNKNRFKEKTFLTTDYINI